MVAEDTKNLETWKWNATKDFKAEFYFVIRREKKEMDRQIVLLQIG